MPAMRTMAAVLHRFYRFLLCTWEQVDAIGTKEGLDRCFREVGIPPDSQEPVMACINGTSPTTGAARLLSSVKHAHTRGVEHSCTVFVAGGS